MKKKTLSFEIPEYLTLHQYSKMSGLDDVNKVQKMITIISALTGYEEKEVETWSLDSLQKVFEAYSSLADTKNEFHSLIEWNGTLYGYSDIKSMTLGCYVDLENLSKDLDKNLHKIAALLYRPVTKHRFGSLKFTIKQQLKMVKNNVENVFDWYELEPYDVAKRKQREEEFKSFPAHILLGALGFFLSTASLYLNSTAYSQEVITEKTMINQHDKVLESLLVNIGAGSGLYTHSAKPIFLKLPAISLS
jgi:hypothetical protein